MSVAATSKNASSQRRGGLEMKNTPSPFTDGGSYLFHEWAILTGAEVEVRLAGEPVRKGRVDAATDDGRILWLSQDGNCGRALFDKADGFQMWLAWPELQRAVNLAAKLENVRLPQGRNWWRGRAVKKS